MSKETMQIIDDLVLNNDLCVLATTDGIQPHTSLMTYVVDHASMKFYFLTPKDSRKTKNIKSHPHVSLFIGLHDPTKIVSIHGVYAPIKNRQTANAILKMFFHKHPELVDFYNEGEVELIRIVGRDAQLATGVDQTVSMKFNFS